MKLFVTGGTGFIGSHFLNAAHSAGHEIVALRRSALSQPRVPLLKNPEWLTREMNKVTPDDIAGCDIFVHLAAAGVSPQKADWPELLRANVTDSVACWLSAISAGTRRFIICGSCFEYGKSAERYEFIPPDAPLEPTSGYGASKAAATVAATALAFENQLKLLILRPFQTFGEGQHESNFWSALKKASQSGLDFPMTSGEQIRDFTPVEEVAAAFVSAVSKPDLDPGRPKIENLGTGKPQTLFNFAQTWWSAWKSSGNLLPGSIPNRPNEVMRYVPQIHTPWDENAILWRNADPPFESTSV